MKNPISLIIKKLKSIRVPHAAYLLVVERVFNAILASVAGEVVVVVGPSRVGKSRAVVEACSLIYKLGAKTPKGAMPVVFVEAENASKNGEFSTKAFIVECLRAVKHPIYGVAEEDDEYEGKLSALHHRTPEGVLRGAFETALKLLKTQILVVDEAQHVEYAVGGESAAAKVLNSWKCIGNKCGLIIVLSGTYPLLNIISLAPHLVGRQRPIEFPRYKTESLQDVGSFEQILLTLNEFCASESDDQSLCNWSKLLMTESLGCIGHLSKWLRSAFADMISYKEKHLTEKILLRSRLPTALLAPIAQEIKDGEIFLAEFLRMQDAENEMQASNDAVAEIAKPKKAKPKKTQPFQRKARRNPRGGRG